MIWTDERIKRGRQSLEEWRGTPHYNCLRIKGVGVDCVNFVSAVFIEAGILDDVPFGRYPTTEGQDNEKTALATVLMGAVECRRVEGWQNEPNALWFGDIAIFKTRPQAAHMAFYDGFSIWHAIAKRSVMETPFDDWKNRIAAFYRVTKDGWKQNPGVLLRKYS